MTNPVVALQSDWLRRPCSRLARSGPHRLCHRGQARLAGAERLSWCRRHRPRGL